MKKYRIVKCETPNDKKIWYIEEWIDNWLIRFFGIKPFWESVLVKGHTFFYSLENAEYYFNIVTNNNKMSVVKEVIIED